MKKMQSRHGKHISGPYRDASSPVTDSHEMDAQEVRPVRRCARKIEARGDHAVLDGMRAQYMPMLSDYKVVSFATCRDEIFVTPT